MLTSIGASVSAEETTTAAAAAASSKLIISEPVSMNLNPLPDWYSATQENIDKACISKLDYTESMFKAEKTGFGLVYASCNENAKNSIYIYQTVDNWSQSVFDLSASSFANKTELPGKVTTLPMFSKDRGYDKINIGTPEVITYNNGEYAVFDMWYTKNKTQHTSQVLATVVNGYYVVIFYDIIPNSKAVTKEIPDSAKNSMKGFMKSVSYLDVQEKSILSREQIIIIAGAAACLLFLAILSSLVKSRKRKRYL